jgi:hypothetical protein
MAKLSTSGIIDPDIDIIDPEIQNAASAGHMDAGT